MKDLGYNEKGELSRNKNDIEDINGKNDHHEESSRHRNKVSESSLDSIDSDIAIWLISFKCLHNFIKY